MADGDRTTRNVSSQSRDTLRKVAEDAGRAAELARREAAGERLTRSENRALTRDRLLDAAADVFSRLGYHGASLETVAEAAGYTKGAVYSNFATKGDLFLALCRRYSVRRHAELSAAMTGLSADQLAGLGEAILLEQTQTHERWDLLQMEFWLAAMRDPELRAAMASDDEQLWSDMGAQFDRTFAREGLTPPFTGTEFAKLVNALGSGLVLQLHIDPDFIHPDLFARAIRALSGVPTGAAPSTEAPAEPTATLRQPRDPKPPPAAEG